MLQRYRESLSVVAINDIADVEVGAHLFKHDTNDGAIPGEVTVGEGVMEVDDATISVKREQEPSGLPWKKLGVDVVVESTGVFTDARTASAHLQAGARRAVITAPSCADWLCGFSPPRSRWWTSLATSRDRARQTTSTSPWPKPRKGP